MVRIMFMAPRIDQDDESVHFLQISVVDLRSKTLDACPTPLGPTFFIFM